MTRQSPRFALPTILLSWWMLLALPFTASAVQVAANSVEIGNDFSEPYIMLMRADGGAVAWGFNRYGQQGVGSSQFVIGSPHAVGGTAAWASIAVAGDHAAGVRPDGTLWIWGRDGGRWGGDSSIFFRDTPVQLGTDADWARVAISSNHMLALKTDGSLWSAGTNFGQLGLGTRDFQIYPLSRVGADNDWVAISAGDISLAVKANGTLWAFGSSFQIPGGYPNGSTYQPVQVGTDTDWAQVETSHNDSFYAAIKTNGTLWMWGRNDAGQLGRGNTQSSYSIVQQVVPGSTWQSVDLARTRAIGVRADGSLWQWGRTPEDYDETARQILTRDILSPEAVAAPGVWVDAAVSDGIAMAVRQDGTTWGWGISSSFVGIDPLMARDVGVPRPVNNDVDWEMGRTGWGTSFAIKTDGSLWAWGDNGNGDLGLTAALPGTITTPTRIGLDNDWVDVRTGFVHTLGLRADGSLWSWGRDTLGSLGLGVVNDPVTGRHVDQPTRIGSDADWAQIAAGEDSSFAIKQDGSLWAWGENNQGQLGDGTVEDRDQPTRVGTDNDWAAVASGWGHTIALKTDGSLWGWGRNSNGSVGDGTWIDRLLPVRVGLDNDWTAVATGDSHSIALKADGSLWGWGDGRDGQHGQGHDQDTNQPGQIGVDTDWVSIGTGDDQSFAVKADGSIWAWGENRHGVLGVGSFFPSQTTPMPIASNAAWYSMGTGVDTLHALAVQCNGTLWAWGDNGDGEHGRGQSWTQLDPVQIEIPPSPPQSPPSTVDLCQPQPVEGVDLVVSSVSTTPSGNIYTGNSLTVDFAIHNGGTEPVAPVSYRAYLYISSDATIESTDTYLGYVWLSTGLQAGQTQNYSRTVTVPTSLSSGAYHVGVIVDATNAQVEANEDNNTLAGPVLNIAREIDLAPTTINVTPALDVFTGDSLSVQFSVVNNGQSTTAPNSYRAYLYLSADPVIESSDTYLGYVWLSTGHAGGQTLNYSRNITIPTSLAGGSYQIGVIVDATDAQPEVDEANNTLAAPAMTVTREIDLAVASASVTPGGTVSTGSAQTVDFAVINHGRSTTTPSSYRAYLYLSTDQVIESSDTYLGYVWLSTGHAGGQTLSYSRNITIPTSLDSGTYHVGVVVDATDAQPEINEANNTAIAGTLSVIREIDLAVASASVTPGGTVFTGSAQTVDFAIINNGTSTTTPSSYRAYLYLSADQVIEASDTYLGYVWLSTGHAGGQTLNYSSNITIPTSLDSGTYHVGLIVDATDAQPETDETNNTAIAGTLEVMRDIDLAVASASVTPGGTVSTGSMQTVDFSIVNNGTSTTTPSSYRAYLYLSTDPVIESSDTYLGYVWLSTGHAGGQTLSYSRNITIPTSLASGPYYVGVVVDATDAQPETDETNNTAIAGTLNVVRDIDLAVASAAVTPGGTAYTGSAQTVDFSVVNNGTSTTTPSSYRAYLYLSADQVIEASDTYLGYVWLSTGHAGGQSLSYSRNITIPTSQASGTYYVGVVVDATDAQPETDETNNTAIAGTLNVVRDIDLAVASASVTPGGTAYTGSVQTVDFSVVNNGSSTTTPSSYRAYLYLSTDPLIEASDTYLGYVWLSTGHAGGQTLNYSRNITIPAGLASGTYHVGVIIDATGAQPESDETNNTAVAGTLNVLHEVDLSVASITATPATGLTAGGTVNLSFTVLNSGGSTTSPNSYRAYLYVSTDAVIDASDTYLGYVWLSTGHAGGASLNYSSNPALPASLAAGDYHFGVIVDATDGQLETDETNNTGATGPLPISAI